MGFWWLTPTSYRTHDLPRARWINMQECVAPCAAHFSHLHIESPPLSALARRPSFDLPEKERRPMGVQVVEVGRDYRRGYNSLDPVFLLGGDLLELATALDARGLQTLACDVSYCGGPTAGDRYALATAVSFDALHVFDRAASAISIELAVLTDGERHSNVEVAGEARLKPEIIGDADVFFIRLGSANRKLAVSARFAEAMFAHPLPGVMLEDVADMRAAPQPYTRYSRAGWRLAYPI